MGLVEKEKKIIDTKQYSQFFEEFKALRTKIAQEDEVAPYIVFSDKILVELSDKLPQTSEELLAINGIGESKLEKYGEAFLELCQKLKPTQKKKLTKTYLETLELIEEGKSVEEIAQAKGVQSATILSHIKLLKEHDELLDIQIEELFKPLIESFPSDLKQWCENGLEGYDIKTLKFNLNLYEQLFLKDE